MIDVMLIGINLMMEVGGDLTSLLRLFLMLWAQRHFGMIMESLTELWYVPQLHSS